MSTPERSRSPEWRTGKPCRARPESTAIAAQLACPGEPPELALGLDTAGEAALIVARLREWIEARVEPSAIAVVARTHDLIDSRYAPILEEAEIPFEQLSGGEDGDDPPAADAAGKPGKVALATMHRVKGLEFARVILAGVQEGTVPLRLSASELPDEAAAEAHEQQEMKLLYVAATRARDRLVLAGYGRVPAWAAKHE